MTKAFNKVLCIALLLQLPLYSLTRKTSGITAGGITLTSLWYLSMINKRIDELSHKKSINKKEERELNQLKTKYRIIAALTGVIAGGLTIHASGFFARAPQQIAPIPQPIDEASVSEHDSVEAIDSELEREYERAHAFCEKYISDLPQKEIRRQEKIIKALREVANENHKSLLRIRLKYQEKIRDLVNFLNDLLGNPEIKSHIFAKQELTREMQVQLGNIIQRRKVVDEVFGYVKKRVKKQQFPQYESRYEDFINDEIGKLNKAMVELRKIIFPED